MIIKQGLPKNWVLTDIETIRLDLHEGITPNKFPDQKFELYSVPQFEVGKPEIAYGKEIGSSKQVVANNTVLLCKINPRINRVWITGDHYSLKTICSTEWIPFFQLTALNSKYLSYFLQNPIFREFLSINVSGVGGSLTRTKPSAFKDYPFPLSPLLEQNQIVAKIEEVFSELDNGIENLKKAREQLKTYRQAVLKYAFEGKLTKEWRILQMRSENPPEPAEKLLEQIKTEREKHYQKQLEDWGKACELAKADGKKKPVKPKKPDFYPALTKKEILDLPLLPHSWCWEKIGNLCQSIVPNRDKPKTFTGNIPWLTTPDLDLQKITVNLNLINNRLSKEEINKYNARLIPENSVIMTCVGTFGVTCINNQECIINQQLHAFITHRFITSRYVAYALKFKEKYMEQNSTSTTISYLNKTKCNSLPIPICAIDEQKAIVEAIESRLSVCDKIEQTIEDSLKKAEALRQSSLKKAFAGELTRDWREKHPELIAGENSAEKLLENIKAEKVLADARKNLRKSKRKKKK
jgi:type I restriction enzyme S subunit